jgi:WD40 repeat protein
MSDDEEELAALRAARAARMGLGPAGAPPPRRQYGAAPPPRDDDDDDDDHAEDDDEREQEQLRAMAMAQLPMSFGKSAGGAAAAPPPAGRSTYGPMRPPPPQQPRPPAPPPPPPKPAAAEDDEDAYGPPRPPRSDDDDNEEEDYGPPRPPPASGRRRRRSEEHDDDEKNSDDDASDDDDADDDPYALPLSQEATFGIGEGGDKPGAKPARSILAVAVDPQGSRLATGGGDRVARIYDFAAMRADLRPLRELRGDGGGGGGGGSSDAHAVVALSWSPQGENLLVVSSCPTARFYDRDGRSLGETARGDMYVRDPRHTRGHTAALTAGCWHPSDRSTALTCSEDGTLRLWDTTSAAQRTVIKPAVPALAGGGGAAGGGRVRATACAFSPGSGSLIAAGLSDGSVQLWQAASPGSRMGQAASTGVVAGPTQRLLGGQSWSHVAPGTCGHRVVKGAHESGVEVSCVAFAPGGGGASPAALFASRSLDGTVRLWDARKLSSSSPSASSGAAARGGAGGGGRVQQHPALLAEVASGLWSDAPNAAVAFSPDGKLLVAGCASPGGGKGGGGAQLVFLDVSGALPPPPLPAAAGGATRPSGAPAIVIRRLGVAGCADLPAVCWHPRLNQIFFGGGDARSGTARVLFDPRRSTRGALSCVDRAPRRPEPDDFALRSQRQQQIIVPGADGRRGGKRPALGLGGGGGGGGGGGPPRPGPGGGSGAGGSAAAAAAAAAASTGGRGGTMLTGMLMRQQGKSVVGAGAAAAAAATGPREDVRAAMLRHPTGGGGDAFSRLTAAYAKTQPKPIFAEEEEEEGEDGGR